MLSAIFRLIRRTIITLLISDVICLVWQIAEIQMYGEVQYRAVDDFIMFIIAPVIYLAVAGFEDRKYKSP